MTKRQEELLLAYKETGNYRFFAKAAAIEKGGEVFDHTRRSESSEQKSST